ncbi:MAG: polysaccharide deacetylase family protein [Armatimonadota bacterium]
MKYTYLLWIIIALLSISSSAGFGAPEEYLERVSGALDALQTGGSQEAVIGLKKALGVNANDPLAHVAMGFALMCGNRLDDAAAEFGIAQGMDKKCAQAIYGKGLVYLSKRQFSKAAACFADAQTKNSEINASGAIAYVKSIVSGSYSNTPDTEDQAAQAMNAIWLMSQGRHSDALAVWSDLQSKVTGSPFGERLGCSMTFLRSGPVATPNWPIKPAELHQASAPVGVSNLPTVSGIISLRADLRKARSVIMVSFFVDDRLVGITNNPPFTYSWDTTDVANGTHTVKIQGMDDVGSIVSEKTMGVAVKNIVASPEPKNIDPAESAKLWDRLWGMMVLKPSRAAINYNLAQCAMKIRKEDISLAALERAIAADPEYLDSVDQLSRLKASSGTEAKLFEVQTSKKLIALSFDDGPKKDTAKLLDVLKAKGVKATFFVVGKQVAAFPDVLKRMSAEGHDIQNHTYNHRALEYLSTEEIQREVAACAVMVRSITGHGTSFLRPPGAHAGKKLPAVMKQFGMQAVYWSTNCAGEEGTNRQKMQNYVVATARPGGIILMHNFEGVTFQALPGIIDALRKRGYEFVTIADMVRIAK